MARGAPRKTNQQYKRTAPYDPRVDMFKQFYLRPDSYTFMNVRQSALRAGYTEHYANSLSSVSGPKWYIEMIETGDYRRAQMLDKAEQRLYERVEEAVQDKDGRKLQADVAKFVTERLGKDKYSVRQEVTGADGRRLFDNKAREDASTPVAQLFKGVHDPNA
jgi:hypothetical protein